MHSLRVNIAFTNLPTIFMTSGSVLDIARMNFWLSHRFWKSLNNILSSWKNGTLRSLQVNLDMTDHCTVRRIFAYDGRYAWSQSDAHQVFVICIWRILHMTDQFSWSHWVHHIQVHLYNVDTEQTHASHLQPHSYKMDKSDPQEGSLGAATFLFLHTSYASSIEILTEIFL